MSVLKEHCPNCGGTIILPQNASIGECDYCGMTYSLAELQKIKDAIIEKQQLSKESDCDLDENEPYGSALDTNEADELSIYELCKKSEMALESEQWQIADSFSDEILRRDPKYAKAYLYKLLAEHKVFKKEALANAKKPFDDSDNYRLLLRFAEVYLKTEIENYSNTAKSRYQAQTLESQYQALCSQMKTASTKPQYQMLADGFHNLGDYKDSPRLSAECLGKIKSAAQKEHRNKTIKRLLAGIVILGIAFAVLGVPLLKKASYRADLFSVEVTDKVNVDYDDDTVSFVFKFNIINESRHNANYLEGYITISDADGTVLASGSTWFSGVIAAHNKNYHELSLDLERNGAGRRIWNSDFTELVITYRITEIRFEDGTVKEFTGKDIVVNKT